MSEQPETTSVSAPAWSTPHHVCKNCRWWAGGWCKTMRFHDITVDDLEDPLARVPDDETDMIHFMLPPGSAAAIVFGSDFGCIHWETKDETDS